ncbi:MAG: hypothetical protein AB1806_02225 [Acidobacteriota bacterium]
MRDSLTLVLLVLGIGFLAANVVILVDYVRFIRVRHGALLVWRLPPQGFAVLNSLVGVALGALIVYKLFALGWHPRQIFGEAMMFLYFAFASHLSARISRGFYERGIWLERGFVRYKEMTGATWREEPGPTLVVVAGQRQRAGRLPVPPHLVGEARHILHERVKEHQLHFDPPLLDLGGHDERDDI